MASDFSSFHPNNKRLENGGINLFILLTESIFFSLVVSVAIESCVFFLSVKYTRSHQTKKWHNWLLKITVKSWLKFHECAWDIHRFVSILIEPGMSAVIATDVTAITEAEAGEIETEHHYCKNVTTFKSNFLISIN